MAPKRPTLVEDPPAVSSSEEETSSEGEEEEEEDGSSEEDEEQETQTQPQKHSALVPHTKRAPKQDESDSEVKTTDNATVNPVATKPMEVAPTKTTKCRSNPSVSTPSTAKSTAAIKRGSETDRDELDSKRSKKKNSEADGVAEKSEDKRKQQFQRLWSEDDEIAVLEGYIHFIEKKRTDPAKDMALFFYFVKKSLHLDVSLNQFRNKVRKLKKKFENHVSKGKRGEDKTFSKLHDQKLFDLSKKIWGSEGVALSDKLNSETKRGLQELKEELGVGVEREKESNSGQKQVQQFDKGASVAGIGGMTGIEDYILKRGLDMLDGTKKTEMEEKWRKLHVAELELFLKRNEMIREQTKLMLAEYKTE